MEFIKIFLGAVACITATVALVFSLFWLGIKSVELWGMWVLIPELILSFAFWGSVHIWILSNKF